MIPEFENDHPRQNRNFLCGVVEGFYGRPWTTKQRRKLFERMKKMGMNTYLYAPKDDCKHRMYWRDLYSVEEADHLTGMIESAAECDVLFVYALSPGLDMNYSNSKEVTYLKRKLEQVASFGCKAFALLFDDIEVDLCEADKQVFQSFAQAHVSVTNEVYQHLEQPSTFLFCPTEYCATRTVPNVRTSEYLNTIGSKLLPDIDIMWTGDKVITKEISLESVHEIARVLRRPPVIWDNFHANDYDQARMFLGPYDGRSPEIIPYLRGVLTNPNCEFEANYIPMHTLASWSKSNMEDVKKGVMLSNSPVSSDINLETEGEVASAAFPSYMPKQALKAALEDWLLEFSDDCDVPRKIASAPAPAVIPPLISTANTASTDTIPSPSLPLAVAASIGVTNINELSALESYIQPSLANQANSLVDPPSDSETDSVTGPLEPMDCAVTPSTSPALPSCLPAQLPSEIVTNSDDMETELVDGCTLTVDDLEVIVDMFYTPFEHGSNAIKLLSDLNWLVTSCHILSSGAQDEESHTVTTEEWKEKALKFEDDVKAFQEIVDRLCNIPNKALLFDLYPYIWDIKSSLALGVTYIKWIGLGHVPLISVQHIRRGGYYTWANKAFRDVFSSGEHEPWVFRGGLQGEFKRLVPLEGVQDLTVPTVPSPPVAQCYTIRPFNAATDKQSVYDVCLKTCDDGSDGTDIFPIHKDLVADKFIGAYIEHSPEYCFVVEDSNGVCGYALAALDAKVFEEKLETEWIPTMQKKYLKPQSPCNGEFTPAEEMISSVHNHKSFFPEEKKLSSHPSIVNVSALPDRCSDGAVRHLLAATVACLKTNGSIGIYAEVHVGDRNTVERYGKLGMFEQGKCLHQPEDLVIVCRSI